MLTPSARLAALFALFALAAPVAAHAEGAGSLLPDSAATTPVLLDTDRPDLTDGASRLEPGVVQLETGWSRTSNGTLALNSVGDALVRIGVTRAFELRVFTPGRESFSDGVVHEGEWGELGVGFKLGHTSADGERGIAVVASVSTPAESHGSSLTETQAVLAGDWAMGHVGASANLGIHRVSANGSASNTGLASVSLANPVSPRVGLFFELATEFQNGGEFAWSRFLDAGASWAVAHRFQLDGSIGRFFDATGTWSIGAGLSKRW